MKYILIAIVSILAIANLLIFGIKSPQTATLVITNVVVYPALELDSKTNSVAFNNGKIIYVGSDKHVYPLIAKDTKVFSPTTPHFLYITALKNKDEYNQKTNDLKIIDKFKIDENHNAFISQFPLNHAEFSIYNFINDGKIE